MANRAKIYGIIAVTLSVALFSSVLFAPKSAKAASLSNFNAGHIIDDGIFFNPNSMNVTEVQAFLNSKVPSCDTNGTQNTTRWNSSAGRYYTRAEWGTLNGYPPPYVCLKDFRQDVQATSADSYCAGGTSGGNKSAAQIITEVSLACSINPQSLIVLLQKEQGLVTDDWPWSNQYRSATGYGCPDTAACDSAYYGFFNQVYNAAHQFQRYVKQPQSFNYRSGGSFYILYNPNANCGGTNVFIQNGATAALYNYTPYQPNQSALNAGYGSGDSCGAYGNRNFWLYFNDWFGGTLASDYSWQLVTQYAYTDQTKAQVKDMNSVLPGEKVYVGLTARNTGNTVWQPSGPNAVLLGTAGPLERTSAFSNGSSWPSPTRAAVLNSGVSTSTVSPGQIGTFEFWLTAPSAPGNGGIYNERFNLVANGVTWFNDIGLSYYAKVVPPTYTWQMLTQYAYTDQTKATVKNMNTIQPGDKIYVGFTAKNTGNMTWKNSGANSIMVGTASSLERISNFSSGSNWLSATRPATSAEGTIAPGQTGTFEFWLTSPVKPGSGGIYNERFNLVINGVTWLNDTGLSYYANVAQPIYTWQMLTQYAYTDQTKAQVKDMNSVAPGSKVYVGFTAKNTGNVTWNNTGPNAILVGTANPLERISNFSSGSNWLSATRPATSTGSTITPGQTGTFEFWLTAPATSGIYNERFNLVLNAVSWLQDTGLSYYVHVTP
jgi:hypothetical protein